MGMKVDMRAEGLCPAPSAECGARTAAAADAEKFLRALSEGEGKELSRNGGGPCTGSGSLPHRSAGEGKTSVRPGAERKAPAGSSAGAEASACAFSGAGRQGQPANAADLHRAVMGRQNDAGPAGASLGGTHSEKGPAERTAFGTDGFSNGIAARAETQGTRKAADACFHGETGAHRADAAGAGMAAPEAEAMKFSNSPAGRREAQPNSSEEAAGFRHTAGLSAGRPIPEGRTAEFPRAAEPSPAGPEGAPEGFPGLAAGLTDGNLGDGRGADVRLGNETYDGSPAASVGGPSVSGPCGAETRAEDNGVPSGACGTQGMVKEQPMAGEPVRFADDPSAADASGGGFSVGGRSGERPHADGPAASGPSGASFRPSSGKAMPSGGAGAGAYGALRDAGSEAEGGGRTPQDISSLFSMAFSGTAAPSDPPAAEAPAESAPPAGADLEAMVSRILVSTPDSGRQEVRLSLADGALPGTEIILDRSSDGFLTVRIVSSDENSFQTAVAAGGDLQQMLEERHAHGVRVIAERADGTGGSEAEDGGSRRRSRGLRGMEEGVEEEQ